MISLNSLWNHHVHGLGKCQCEPMAFVSLAGSCRYLNQQLWKKGIMGIRLVVISMLESQDSSYKPNFGLNGLLSTRRLHLPRGRQRREGIPTMFCQTSPDLPGAQQLGTAHLTTLKTHRKVDKLPGWGHIQFSRCPGGLSEQALGCHAASTHRLVLFLRAVFF